MRPSKPCFDVTSHMNQQLGKLFRLSLALTLASRCCCAVASKSSACKVERKWLPLTMTSRLYTAWELDCCLVGSSSSYRCSKAAAKRHMEPELQESPKKNRRLKAARSRAANRSRLRQRNLHFSLPP